MALLACFAVDVGVLFPHLQVSLWLDRVSKSWHNGSVNLPSISLICFSLAWHMHVPAIVLLSVSLRSRKIHSYSFWCISSGDDSTCPEILYYFSVREMALFLKGRHPSTTHCERTTTASCLLSFMDSSAIAPRLAFVAEVFACHTCLFFRGSYIKIGYRLPRSS